MWDWLKDAGKKMLESGAAYVQHRAFIQSLFTMTQEQAYFALKQKIEELDDTSIQIFSNALTAMIGEAQQAAQQTDDTAWGTSYEDRLAYSMARIQSGAPAQQNTQAQMYLQGLNAVAHFATQFYQEKLARAAQIGFAGNPQQQNVQTSAPDSITPPPASAEPPPSNTGQSNQLEAMFEAFVQSGKLDPAMMEQMASVDPATLEKLLAKAKELGVDVDESAPKIADYYRPRKTKYKLKWPLSPGLSLPIPFDELDQETQFHVLFGECTRRETEANAAIYNGDAATAQTIFEECLERAKQLGVAELKARSYEGMMGVAQKLGDRTAERKWLTAAKKAREKATAK